MRRGSSELVAVHRIAGRSGSARSIRLARHLRPPRSRWPSRSPTPRSPGGAPERPRRPASWLRRHTGEGPDPHSEQRNCRREHRAVGSGDARGNRDGACGHRDSRAASACGSARAPPGVRTKFFLAYQLHTGMPAAGSKVRQSASERGHREVTRAAASEPRGAQKHPAIARGGEPATNGTPLARQWPRVARRICSGDIFGHGRLTGAPLWHRVPRGSCGMTFPISTYSWWAPVQRSSAVRPRPARAAITAARTTAFLM
jgi:hypothetical protein